MGKLLILFMLLPFVKASGQILKGTVYEDSKQEEPMPLVGVNVYWANTQKGTITDRHGHFELKKEDSSALLVLSYIGYEADTVEIRDFRRHQEFVLSVNKQLKEIQVAVRSSGTHLSRIEPLLVQNICGSELKKAACCNLSESFETNASVDVTYSDAVTGAKQIQLLGLSGKYVQLMTENFPNYTGLAKAYGLTYIPGPWLDAIAVSKGTASVVNGYDAISGQINVEYLKPHNSDKFFVNLFANSGARFESNIHSAQLVTDKWSTICMLHSGNNYQKIDHNDDGFIDMPLVQQYHAFNKWNFNNGKGLSWHSGIKFLYEDKLAGQSSYDPELPRTVENGFGIGIDTRRAEAFSKLGYVFQKPRMQSLALIANYSYHSHNSFYGMTDYDAAQASLYANLILNSFKLFH